MIETKQIHEAMDRIARTPDGRIFYLFLQRRLMGISTGTDDGALRQDHGERSFAANLIGLMAKGIADSDGRTSDSTDNAGAHRAEPVIVFAARQPVDTGPRRPRGNERRVTAGTHVSGYDASGADEA